MKTELVPMSEACKLWRKDKRTLIRWADAGIVRFDKIESPKKKYPLWYIETPNGRYNRINNLKNR